MDGAAETMGRMASFYAGYGPTYDFNGLDNWLDACARRPRTTCGQEFKDLYETYQLDFDPDRFPNRADDQVGQYYPMLAVTGVLVGDGVTEWKRAMSVYLSAQPFSFRPSFDDVKFGYFGQTQDLDVIQARLNEMYPDKEHAKKFHKIGPTPWKNALAASISEPGLGNGYELNGRNLIGVGGWADPLRVYAANALHPLGKSIVLTSAGDINGFARACASTLGATDEQLDVLLALSTDDSEILQQLGAASAVWCANWELMNNDPDPLFDDGYGAPMATEDPYLLNMPQSYANTVPPFDDVLGCSAHSIS
eukprot:CAMPEP_0118680402 /NCGR_PEP_ID=MMETSP0800-20121206/4346_1 /TAXON_ID=210618 ORGANISM="Striatella unipunctata, Strain CCMP2910" /NCGR_SAMPLE_ID=MMETSP0800 /ASSEMBLY_ACC=CAM_ASM_000638 /LENGTH=307 /DNA_ID=CAMNT_0006576549 /DNA_START=135 /DNA_END=1058 /DNA_ORIENTATION=+